MTPGEFIPTVTKFLRAYNYNDSRWRVARDLVWAWPPADDAAGGTDLRLRQLFKGWTVMDRLSEIKAPTLVLAGRYDFLFPPEHQAILADRLPNAQTPADRARRPQSSRGTECRGPSGDPELPGRREGA